MDFQGLKKIRKTAQVTPLDPRFKDTFRINSVSNSKTKMRLLNKGSKQIEEKYNDSCDHD